jgi:Tfp pilus assembly protein PilO
MKLSLREAVLFVLLVSIPVGAWWFVFRPRNARNAEMLKQIETKQKRLRALNRVTGTIGNLQKEIAARKQAIDYFQAKLPNEKEIDKVLQEVWRLAEANSLMTKSIRTLSRSGSSGNRDAAGPREQPVAVQLEGDFIGFYTFLQTLENQPRIMRIADMNITKLDKDGEGRIKASFEMTVFFEQEGRERA